MTPTHNDDVDESVCKSWVSQSFRFVRCICTLLFCLSRGAMSDGAAAKSEPKSASDSKRRVSLGYTHQLPGLTPTDHDDCTDQLG